MDKFNTSNSKPDGKIKGYLTQANRIEASSPGKCKNKVNNEYRNILEMWHNYLNFSRLEF